MVMLSSPSPSAAIPSTTCASTSRKPSRSLISLACATASPFSAASVKAQTTVPCIVASSIGSREQARATSRCRPLGRDPISRGRSYHRSKWGGRPMARCERHRESEGGNRKGGETKRAIVCGFDGSTDSDAALAVAARLAERVGARLVLANVVEQVPSPYAAVSVIDGYPLARAPAADVLEEQVQAGARLLET